MVSTPPGIFFLTLFSTTGGLHNTRSPERLVRGRSSPPLGVGVISVHELRELRAKTEKGEQKDAVILPKGEIDRIKANMIFKSPEKLLMEKKMKETQLQESMKASKVKKDKMARFDL